MKISNPSASAELNTQGRILIYFLSWNLPNVPKFHTYLAPFTCVETRVSRVASNHHRSHTSIYKKCFICRCFWFSGWATFLSLGLSRCIGTKIPRTLIQGRLVWSYYTQADTKKLPLVMMHTQLLSILLYCIEQNC